MESRLVHPPEARIERIPNFAALEQVRRDAPTRWSVVTALAAIDAHELGDFYASGCLAEAFERDDRIRGCMSTRVNAISAKNGLDFQITPPEGQSDKLAKAVGLWWFDALPDSTLTQLARDMLKIGVFIGRIHYLRLEREWRPVRIERWRPENVRWNDERGCYTVRTFDDEVDVRPDDPNWLIIEPGGEASWMSGAVRALGLAYLMRSFNWRDWARFNERHGLPIIALTEPSNAEDKDRKAFYSGVQKMGSTGIIRLPQNVNGTGFGMSMIEAQDRSWQTFQEFRKDLDISIAVTLLGQNLSTEVQGGSFAAANIHDRIRQDFLQADTEILATALRAQLICRWGRFNVAGWDDSMAPWPTWDTSVPVDRQTESDTLTKISTAVATFQSTGMPVDYAEVFRRVGIPMVEGKDPNAAKPPTPPAAPVAPVPAGGRAAARAEAKLASGAKAAANEGFLNGQLYADELVDRGAEAAAKADTFVSDLLGLIDQGGSYEEIREAVIAHYAGAEPPAQVRDILLKVLVLANLAGRRAVLEDA
jgi:phage gp29-like protein